jgi:hypothetical protein
VAFIYEFFLEAKQFPKVNEETECEKKNEMKSVKKNFAQEESSFSFWLAMGVKWAFLS